MSNTKNYIITTLSSGSQEFNNSISNTYQAPFSLASSTVIGLRQKGAPYTVSQAQNLYSRKILDAEPIIAPIAKYTFDVNPDDGTVNDDSGNGLTGTLGCASGSQLAYNDGTCTLPRFNDGTYTPSPLVGANCLYLDGGYGTGTNLNGVVKTQQWQKAGYVKFQSLITEPKWKILTGSHSVSMWVYPTFRNESQRCKTYAGTNPALCEPTGTICRDSMNQGSTDLFGMSIDPDLKNPSNTGWSGSFGLMMQQYSMDYYLGGPIKWAFMRPAVWPNPATVYTYTYPVMNRNCEYQTGYFTNEAWNHIMYCVSGSEGNGNRFVAMYVNGHKLDAGENSQINFPAFITMSADYDLTFSVTASQQALNPENIYLGDVNPVSIYDIHYSGSFDQVAVWDRYFTAKQVTQIYQSSGTLFDVDLPKFPYKI